MRARLLPSLLLSSTASQALEPAGRDGYAGDRAVTAVLAETASASSSREKRDCAGPGEVAEKSGTLNLRRDGRRHAAMPVTGEERCAATGALSEDGVVSADCGKTGKIPLGLWLK